MIIDYRYVMRPWQMPIDFSDSLNAVKTWTSMKKEEIECGQRQVLLISDVQNDLRAHWVI